ncbi:AI-2E family transporter [Vibrio sp. PP-XX7]
MSDKIKMSSSHWVILVALLLAATTCYFLIAPYINAIVIAFIISLLIFPIHEQIESRLTSNKNVASFLSCLILTFIIVIPLLFVFVAIVQQGAHFSQNSVSVGHAWWRARNIKSSLGCKILAFINTYLPVDKVEPAKVAQKIGQLVSQFGTQIVGISARVLGDATAFIMHFFLMLFVLFFLLRDHENIIASLHHILPLSRSQEDKLLNEIEKVSKSAVMGSFLTALAQGLAGGLGMWFAGLPGLFWGTMIGFASFIPVIGTALIWIPASLYLYLTGDTYWAIFLAAWGIVVVGSIDHLLRPFLMQGSAGMNTLMIFFSLLGGIHLFGLMGLIYGPLIFAITIVLFHIYEEEFRTFLDKQDNS